MDMAFFPHNDMFAEAAGNRLTASTYGVKINDRLVPITHYPYWKKDFLEMSLFEYASYIEHDNKVYLDDYLLAANISPAIRQKLSASLTPDDIKAQTWPFWFAGLTGIKINFPCKAEIIRYNYTFSGKRPALLDSSAIYSIYIAQ
jgi:hypothetical protein